MKDPIVDSKSALVQIMAWASHRWQAIFWTNDMYDGRVDWHIYVTLPWWVKIHVYLCFTSIFTVRSVVCNILFFLCYNNGSVIYTCSLRLRVRSHVRFVRNPHGLLHFWLVTFQQEWSHGVHCGAVRPANQAKKLLQPHCQKLPQRPLRLKRHSPSTCSIICYTIGFLGNGAVAAAPCDHPTLCGEICPQPHTAHVTVA